MAEEASEFKIAVIGKPGVGKSLIVRNFLGDNEGDATDRPANTSKTMDVQGKEVTLQIIDTTGTVERSVYKEARGVMVVYDITDKSTFDSCSFWLQEIDEHCQRYPAIAVIGNKCDLEDTRVVSKQTLEGFAMDYGVSFLEVSGKTGKFIPEAFNLLAEDILYENEELKASHGHSQCCSIL